MVSVTNAFSKKESNLDRFRKLMHNVRPGPQVEAMTMIGEYLDGEGMDTKRFKDIGHFRRELSKYFRHNYKKLDHFALISDAVHLARSDVILAIADAAYGGGGFHLFKTPVADSPRPVDDEGNVIRGFYDILALRHSTSTETEDDNANAFGGDDEELEQNTDAEHTTAANCMTLLHRQAVEGDTAKMQALLQAVRMSARTDVEGLKFVLNLKACGTVGATAFELACWHGYPEIVNFLLKDMGGPPKFGDVLHIDNLAVLSALQEGKPSGTTEPLKLKAPSEMTDEEIQAEIRKKEKHNDYEVVIKSLLDHAHRHDHLRELYVNAPLVYKVNILEKLKDKQWTPLIKLFKPTGEYRGKPE